MIKTIYAIAAALVIAAAITLAPGFSPQVEASVPVAMSKHDKLDVRTEARCTQQAWPNIDAACLRTVDNKPVARPVRVISTNRS